MALHGLCALLVLLLTTLPACRAASGTILRLYTPPTDSSWTTVAKGKTAHLSVTVMTAINPSNGTSPGPGSSKIASYDTGITTLAAAGVKVLGSVSTRYGERPISDVQRDISTYKSFYNGLSGVFLTEMANKTGKEQYYTALSAYAKNIPGMLNVVGDPGTNIPLTYARTVDIVIIYEAAGLPTAAYLAPYPNGDPRAKWGTISYLVSSLDLKFVSNAVQHVGNVYMTDSNLPKPGVPSYFDALLAALETPN